ncbi:hypothetical protein WJX81_000052 [Elliptochloris bilobata]|uniref:HIT-type domain-containing protein n=1 Tax=Elliptochloris bilobata TaxID=381761 RepID=A0AAW1RK81_9CHLO
MAVVSDAERTQAATARLAALEDDDFAAVADAGADNSDDDFLVDLGTDDEPELGESAPRKRRKSRGGGAAGRGPKRKTRAMLEAERRGPRTFAGLLEETESASLEEGGPPPPAYTAAAVGPQVGAATRRWCSVCGFAAPYRCVRCGSRFCTRKCYGVHTETRCLKFVG